MEINCSIPPGTKVLITGATGFTGTVLTEKLCKAGLDVHAIARESSNISTLSFPNLTLHRGQVYDKSTLASAAEGVEYIFHVAAAYREAKIADSEYRRVHVESTQILAALARDIPGFKRFVHVSTIGVHGHIENPPADEFCPFAPGDLYQITKLEAEQWLREFAKNTSLPFTIIRPTAIYGPGDKRLLKVYKMATWPVFPILGRGKCLYHLIHVQDLTDAIILSATHLNALGETFIVGAESPIRLVDFAKIVAQECGTKLRILRIPAWPFFILGDICEAVCKPFSIEPPIYRRRVAFYTKDRAFKTEKVTRLLGFKPKFDNDQGIRNTAQWYIANGWLKTRRNPPLAPHTTLNSESTKKAING